MSRQRHPDAETLARYQAGQAGGFRGRQLAAHVASCAHCASVTDQLAAVSTVLAAVPAPPMPDAVERQIMAALTAEAATRTAEAAAGAATRQASPAGGRAGAPQEPRRSRAHGFRPAMAFASAAACLLLAGFGYLLSQTQSSSSSSATSAAAPAAGSAASGAAGSRVPGPQRKAISPTTGMAPFEGQPAPFLVEHSGINYQQATLAAQVRAELTRNGAGGGSSSPSAAAATPGASGPVPGRAESSQATSSTGGVPPSRALTGCVSYLIGNLSPSLVDRATYEGKPVYVIAAGNRAWVVGLGCTASNRELVKVVDLPASG